MPAQLDYSGQFAAFFVNLADRRSGGFVNDKHGADMGGRTAMGKHYCKARRLPLQRIAATRTSDSTRNRE
jgi:hypothetical protein